MKVGYLSDCHLEFLRYPSFSKEEGGDVLILAGDILTAYMISGYRTDQDAIDVEVGKIPIPKGATLKIVDF